MADPPADAPDFTRREQCAVCGQRYLAADNVGQWRCRVHPDGIDDDGYFTCCRTYADGAYTPAAFYARGTPFPHQRGCQPHDHVPELPAAEYVDIDAQGVYHLAPQKRTVQVIPGDGALFADGNTYRVWRVDRESARRNALIMHASAMARQGLLPAACIVHKSLSLGDERAVDARLRRIMAAVAARE